jgi:hypothetical protein
LLNFSFSTHLCPCTHVNQSCHIWYVTGDCCQKDMLLYRILGGFCRDVCASSGCLRSHLPHTLHWHCLWQQNSRTTHQRVWAMLRLTVDRSWYWGPVLEFMARC